MKNRITRLVTKAASSFSGADDGLSALPWRSRFFSIPGELQQTRTPAFIDWLRRTLTWRSEVASLVGFAVLVFATQVGEQLKILLHLPVSGNLAGLFLLILCLDLELIQPQLIEEAAGRLIYIMPALFIPLFVSAVTQKLFYSEVGCILLPALLIATAFLWMLIGHVAQYLLPQEKASDRLRNSDNE